MKISLRGFGSARGLNGVSFELHHDITIADLRQYLQAELPNLVTNSQEILPLLASCAFATNQQVLADDLIVNQDIVLNVLPPVCGG